MVHFAAKQGLFRHSAASLRGIEDGFVQLRWSQSDVRRCFGAGRLCSAFGG